MPGDQPWSLADRCACRLPKVPVVKIVLSVRPVPPALEYAVVQLLLLMCL